MCLSCSNVCPVKIDLGEQIYRWRQELPQFRTESKEKRIISIGMKMVFNKPKLYTTALKFAPLANKMPNFLIYNKLNKWGKEHEMMTFPNKSFHEMWEKGEVK